MLKEAGLTYALASSVSFKDKAWLKLQTNAVCLLLKSICRCVDSFLGWPDPLIIQLIMNQIRDWLTEGGSFPVNPKHN